MSLEEKDDVLTVRANVAFDPRGGVLVADVAEGQLRSYGMDGALQWASGRKGEGPDEYRNLVAARRLPDGRLVVVERTDRMVLRDVNGDSLLAELKTNLYHVADVHVLDDSTALITGVAGNEFDSPRIHVWSFPRKGIRKSFFNPFENVTNRTAAITASWASIDVRGDSLAAVFAVSDSVYIYNVNGDRARSLPFPSGEFRRVPSDEPGRIEDPRRRAGWLQSFDFVADVHWMTPDTIIVVYQNVVAARAMERQWHLLGISASSGERLFELTNLPRLIAADPASRTLVFQDPTSEVPNRWIIGSLR